MVAGPSSCFAAGLTILCLSVSGCAEGGTLGVSARTPVIAAVNGRITDCERPAAGVHVFLRVRQDSLEQAPPVDVRIGPLTTSSEGAFFTKIGPLYAVPGRASVQLTVRAAGLTIELEEFSIRLEPGTSARHAVRIDIDLADQRGRCGR